MARGAKTSSIPRASSRVAKTRPKTSPKPSSRNPRQVVADYTRPTPRPERIIPKIFGFALLALGALMIIVALGNSFVWLPAKSWLGQRDQSSGRQEQLDVIKRATDELQTEVDRLKTPIGVQDAARQELGYVIAGENRQKLIPGAQAPIDLPSGWPYDVVTQIVAVKVFEVEAKAAAELAKNTSSNP